MLLPLCVPCHRLTCVASPPRSLDSKRNKPGITNWKTHFLSNRDHHEHHATEAEACLVQIMKRELGGTAADTSPATPAAILTTAPAAGSAHVTLPLGLASTGPAASNPTLLASLTRQGKKDLESTRGRAFQRLMALFTDVIIQNQLPAAVRLRCVSPHVFFMLVSLTPTLSWCLFPPGPRQPVLPRLVR